MEEQLLKDYTDLEKGAYLGAIASIATADRNASGKETEFLDALADTAHLSLDQKNAILGAAKDPSNLSLQKCLDNLKGSELRFSLITDVITFAKSDGKYSSEEEIKIKEMAQYLGINEEQYGTLSTFVDKAEEANKNGQDVTQANFLNSSGMGHMFQKAGIPTGGIMKGLLGMLAPILIGKMLGGNRNSRNTGGLGGGLGGALGGSLGSGGGLLGGLLGGNQRGMGQQGGGLGSLISVLSGGRGYGGMGNILGSILKGQRR